LNMVFHLKLKASFHLNYHETILSIYHIAEYASHRSKTIHCTMEKHYVG
jgi:hypothetical protein